MKRFEAMLCHTITVQSKTGEVYTGGIAQPTYAQSSPIKARLSSLNYKDMQFLNKVQESNIRIMKMHTMPDAPVKLHDTIIADGITYTVIYEYAAPGRAGIHHKKFYIKHVE